MLILFNATVPATTSRTDGIYQDGNNNSLIFDVFGFYKF